MKNAMNTTRTATKKFTLSYLKDANDGEFFQYGKEFPLITQFINNGTHAIARRYTYVGVSGIGQMPRWVVYRIMSWGKLIVKGTFQTYEEAVEFAKVTFPKA